MTELADPDDAYVECSRQAFMRLAKRNRATTRNPDGLFLFGFTDEHLDAFRAAAPVAFEQIGRPFTVVDCAGKTLLAVYAEIVTGLGHSSPQRQDRAALDEAVEAALLGSTQTVVINRLSA